MDNAVVQGLLGHGAEAARAARRLCRAPGFMLLAAGTVALGVLPSTAFELVGRAVLPRLPYESPERLLVVGQRADWGGRVPTSYPKLQLLRARSRTLNVAGYTGVQLVVDRGRQRVRVAALAVTPAFFRVLNARTLLGRTLRDDEDETPLSHPVVVVSEPFWRRQLGSRPDAVGLKLVINDTPFTVVGVTDAAFKGWWGVVRGWAGLGREDLWIPASMAPVGMLAAEWRTARLLEAPSLQTWGVIGRLRPGFSPSDAGSELRLLGAEVQRIWPDHTTSWPVPFEAVPAVEDAVDPKLVRTVGLLRIAGALVAVLAAANVGLLFLARIGLRARALAIQRALGCPRRMLVMGGLLEAGMVGLAGAALALVLVTAAAAVLQRVEPTALSAPFGVPLEVEAWRATASTGLRAAALGLAAAVLGSVWPWWRASGPTGASVLRAGSGIRCAGLAALRLARPRGLLVVMELALALALTTPALLVARSAARVVRADFGFRGDGVTSAAVSLPAGSTSSTAEISGLLQALRAEPTVASAAFLSAPPFAGTWTSRLAATAASDRGTVVHVQFASPGVFRTLAIPVTHGRDFDAHDQAGAPVAILGQRAAAELGLGVGARVDVPAFAVRGAEVVGIAGDVPYRDPVARQPSAVYLPLGDAAASDGTLLVRSRPGSDIDITRRVDRQLHARAQRIASSPARPFTDHVERVLARFRSAAWLLALAAALSLLLCGAGVYGLLSGLVAGATPEIAIRVALGAAPADVSHEVRTSTLLLAGPGLALGLALGAAGATGLRNELYGVRPHDVWSLVLATILGATIALVTSWRPARRAARVDPVEVLRSE